jgi:hypothetical protein
MTRNLDTTGGAEHVALVKLATKKIIDEFANLRHILISYDEHEVKFEIKIQERYDGYTNAHFDFRPDIFVRCAGKELKGFQKKSWKNIFDSHAILFEAETEPKNIFGNVLKMAAYQKIKSDAFGREAYAFVLVCYEDAVLSESIEPFDAVWKFPRK